eukprot:5628945-Pyramimonas_sp.AAC.1
MQRLRGPQRGGEAMEALPFGKGGVRGGLPVATLQEELQHAQRDSGEGHAPLDLAGIGDGGVIRGLGLADSDGGVVIRGMRRLHGG